MVRRQPRFDARHWRGLRRSCDNARDRAHDLVGAGAGAKDRRDAELFKFVEVVWRNNAAEHDGDIRAALAKGLYDQWREGHVRAGQHRESDHVDVFLDGGRRDRLGGLEEAGVDDFHAGVAQQAGDDLDASIVTVEANFRHQDPHTHSEGTSTWRPKTPSRAFIISPTVAYVLAASMRAGMRLTSGSLASWLSRSRDRRTCSSSRSWRTSLRRASCLRSSSFEMRSVSRSLSSLPSRNSFTPTTTRSPELNDRSSS